MSFLSSFLALLPARSLRGRLSSRFPTASYLAYVQSEPAALCETAHWHFEGQRKWARPARLFARPRIEDYEWKLFPFEPRPGAPAPQARILDAPRHRFDRWEGYYYVLTYDRDKLEFLLQHDTLRGGAEPPLLPEVSHYTGIDAAQADLTPPPTGWLAEALMKLTHECGPNNFSFT